MLFSNALFPQDCINIWLKHPLVKEVSFSFSCICKSQFYCMKLPEKFIYFFRPSTLLLCSQAFVRHILAKATRQTCILVHEAPLESCNHKQHAAPSGNDRRRKLVSLLSPLRKLLIDRVTIGYLNNDLIQVFRWCKWPHLCAISHACCLSPNARFLSYVNSQPFIVYLFFY